ncbi:hypothetical protein L218DRAFT_957474 [Marasmius fiardii PR-910]|nr:hypothetical protein L218DRAFT_957474 [Marasmius fiardii PR-910]
MESMNGKRSNSLKMLEISTQVTEKSSCGLSHRTTGQKSLICGLSIGTNMTVTSAAWRMNDFSFGPSDFELC